MKERRKKSLKRGIDSDCSRRSRSTNVRIHRRETKKRIMASRRSKGSNYSDLDMPKTDITNKEKLVAFYQSFNPAKVNNVDSILEKWSGREGELFHLLANKYKANPSMFSLDCKSRIVGASMNHESSFGLSTKHSGFGSVGSAPTNSMLSFGKANSSFTALQNKSAPSFSSLASAAPTTRIFGSLAKPETNVIDFQSMGISKSTNAEDWGRISGIRTRFSFQRENGMDCD